jgi:hypothetical protein
MLFNNTQVRFSYCGTSVTTHVTPNSHLIFRALLMNYSLSELVSWWKQVDRLLPTTIASSEMQSVWPQLQVTFRMLLSARTLVRIVLALCVPFSQRLKTASSSSCTAQPATAMMRQTCVEPTKPGRPRFHQRTIRRNLRPCFPQPRHLPCCHPNSPPWTLLLLQGQLARNLPRIIHPRHRRPVRPCRQTLAQSYKWRFRHWQLLDFSFGCFRNSFS